VVLPIADGDDQGGQGPHPDEDPVAEDPGVATAPGRRLPAAPAGRSSVGQQEQQDRDERQERDRVECVEEHEAARRGEVDDRAGEERTGAEAGVERRKPERERTRALLGPDHARQQRVLCRPGHRSPEPDERGGGEPMPGHGHAGHGDGTDGRDHQPEDDRVARSHPIGERTPDGVADQRRERDGGQRQTGEAEVDPPHHVQVDEEERQREPGAHGG
jgi:hypothetical protein